MSEETKNYIVVHPKTNFMSGGKLKRVPINTRVKLTDEQAECFGNKVKLDSDEPAVTVDSGEDSEELKKAKSLVDHLDVRLDEAKADIEAAKKAAAETKSAEDMQKVQEALDVENSISEELDQAIQALQTLENG